MDNQLSPLEHRASHPTIYAKWLKRPIDFGLALVLLLILSPLLLALYAVCRVSFGSPVLFSQMRPGLRSKAFKLLKFRTMTNQRDTNEKLLPDEKRLTRFGRFLRSSSLDELPELINILKGDMSFVGPRPLLVQYLPLYSPMQARRHEVRPGLTGWAQVNGRNAISWPEKFKFDVWYVEHLTLLLDFKILLLTVAKILKSDGITPVGEAVMPVFIGNERQLEEPDET